MIDLIFKLAKYIHVAAGVVGLIAGLFSMFYGKKGLKIHKVSGSIFYWSMAIIFITTVLFFVLFPTKVFYHFFLTIGIVSFYPCWSGTRMIAMQHGLKPEKKDIIAGYIIGLSGLGMLIYAFIGIKEYIELDSTFIILFIIFGIISIVNSIGDLKYYLNFSKPKTMHWFFSHGAKMIGAYSAAVTAFCVNILPRYLPKDLDFWIYILIWTAPFVIFKVVAVLLQRKFKAEYHSEDTSFF